MAQLDRDKIKKLKTGENIGTAALFFCGAVLIYFAVMFGITFSGEHGVLKTVMWATAPALMISGVAVAAFCNIKYGGAMERELSKYVMNVLVENAPSMHPERNSLSFTVTLLSDGAEVSVNNFKDKIVFDFSAFGKLSVFRKTTVSHLICDKLAATFCRLYERGVTFKSVDYHECDAVRKKTSRTVPVIIDGMPDKKIMKNYLKNK